MRLTGTTALANATTYASNNPDHIKLQAMINQLATLRQMELNIDASIATLNTSITSLTEALTNSKARRLDLLTDIHDLHKEFNTKYASYIQEGSWTDANYVNDDLYYLDAQSVLYTSARPQIQYDIGVLRLSALPEFANKIFRRGDIAYIEDTDYFGYHLVDGIRTPYREKVVISELVSHFDTPEKDTFKVQNYKTQFEDLFQQIGRASCRERV